MPNKPRLFTRFAKHAAHFTGTPLAFAREVRALVTAFTWVTTPTTPSTSAASRVCTESTISRVGRTCST